MSPLGGIFMHLALLLPTHPHLQTHAHTGTPHTPPPPHTHTRTNHRLLSSYAARVSAEGEYDDAELPPELLDELEGAAGPERTAFAVRVARQPRARA
jgi:hypothetical protein